MRLLLIGVRWVILRLSRIEQPLYLKPDRIQVNLNQPVRLNFLRKDPNSCLEKVLLPDFHKALDLPLNQVQSIEFTPTQTGQYSFHCGMNRFRGVVEVYNPPSYP